MSVIKRIGNKSSALMNVNKMNLALPPKKEKSVLGEYGNVIKH